MEIRTEQKVRSKGNGTERQNPQKWKGKQSMGKNGTETWKEEIWDITLIVIIVYVDKALFFGKNQRESCQKGQEDLHGHMAMPLIC